MELLVRCEIPSKSGLGRDKFTNSFSFMNVPDLNNATLQAITDALLDFYLAVPTGGLQPLKDLFSPEVSTSANLFVIKAYNATGHLSGNTSMGAPVRIAEHTFIAPSGANPGLPAEVAVCVTLETATRAQEAVEEADGGDPGIAPDRPMQRHTGRIFLGPLNTLCLEAVDGIVRPDEQILDTARLAVDQLDSDVFTQAGGAQLAVWSRVDATMRPVEFVSVDNAFDTIRSRGAGPTIRQRDGI